MEVDNLSKNAVVSFDDEDMIYAVKTTRAPFADLRLMPSSHDEWHRDHAHCAEVLVRRCQGRTFEEGRVIHTGNFEARFCTLSSRQERAKYVQDSTSTIFSLIGPSAEFTSIEGAELGQYINATIRLGPNAKDGKLVLCKPEEPFDESLRDAPYSASTRGRRRYDGREHAQRKYKRAI